MNNKIQARILKRLDQIEARLATLESGKPTNTKYRLQKLPDGKVWTMENLREKVKGAVWNQKYNCYMYTWEQAKKAVPKGFHLPSAQEFMRLALSLGYLEKSEEEVVSALQEKCGFTLAGYVDSDKTLYYQGSYGYYWSSTQEDATNAYYLYFRSDGSVNPQGNSSKYYGRAVRCVKDE